MQAMRWINGQLGPKYDDDFTDRLNYVITPAIFATFSMVVAAKQFAGAPLQCWIPAEFKPKVWEKYSESYCFVENTYFVGFDEKKFPLGTEEHERRELLYYQWVSFMLFGQLILFLLPKTIWSALCYRTGFNITALVDLASLTNKIKDAKKDKKGMKKMLKEDLNFKPVAHQVLNTCGYNLRRKPTNAPLNESLRFRPP